MRPSKYGKNVIQTCLNNGIYPKFCNNIFYNSITILKHIVRYVITLEIKKDCSILKIL